MNITVDHRIDLSAIDCANCGVTFAIPTQLETSLRNSHERFFCPHGHANVFKVESETERLKKELAKKDQQLKEAIARREVIKEIPAPINLGSGRQKKVCPHCGKRYKHLKQHIANMHAEVKKNT